ncbi:MAG: hypothetical protein SNJ71_05395, partial [Bacteroidales bacterium]
DYLEALKNANIPEKKIHAADVQKRDSFDRLVFTDAHIGMDTNPADEGLFDLNWDEPEIINTAEMMVQEMCKFRQGDKLFIDNLGDFFDGYDGYTTRKKHKLDQKITTGQAFSLGIKFFCFIIDNLAHLYNTIYINNVCNNNHGGSMDEIFSLSLQHIYRNCERIKVNTITKFLHHYQVGKHCFVITHGKDKRHLEYGWKHTLTPSIAMKIEGFLRHKKIDPEKLRVQIDKGDNHLRMVDDGSSDFFTYNVHPALSPSSSWVQHNFKKGTRGFTMYSYEYESHDFIVKNKNL